MKVHDRIHVFLVRWLRFSLGRPGGKCQHCTLDVNPESTLLLAASIAQVMDGVTDTWKMKRYWIWSSMKGSGQELCVRVN